MRRSWSIRFLLATLFLLWGVSTPATSVESDEVRRGASAREYDYQQNEMKKWLVRLGAFTEYYSKAYLEALVMLDRARSDSMDEQEVTEALQKEWAEAVKRGGEVMADKLRSMSSISSGSGGVFDADLHAAKETLDITRRTCKILEDATAESARVLLRGLHDAMNDHSDAFAQVKRDVNLVRTEEDRLAKICASMSAPGVTVPRSYYVLRDELLLKEKMWVNHVSVSCRQIEGIGYEIKRNLVEEEFPHDMNELADYLIDIGGYLRTLSKSRLKLLERNMFSVMDNPRICKDAMVGGLGTFEVEVMNSGVCDIPDLCLGVDINDLRTGKTVETTRTLRPSSDTPKVMGNIIFGNQQMQTLKPGEERSHTFSCSYRFDKSSTGHEYAPGQYKVSYCVWLGPPGDGFQLMESKHEILTLRAGQEVTAFPRKPNIRIVQFSQEPYPVELDSEVRLMFRIENQSNSPLVAGRLEWWVCNENGELVKKFERTAVSMKAMESRQFSESIVLTSRKNGGRYTGGTHRVLFSACIPSPDEHDAELVVGNRSDLTFQVLIS